MESLKDLYHVAVKDAKSPIVKPYLCWLVSNGYKARLFNGNYIVFDKK